MSHFAPDMSREDFNDAIAAARAQGEATAKRTGDAQVATVNAKFAAIASDAKLKADGRLMGAALELAAKDAANDMSGDEIVAFVIRNVAPTAAVAKPVADLATRFAAMNAQGANDPLFGGSPFPVSSAEDGWTDAFKAASSRRHGKA